MAFGLLPGLLSRRSPGKKKKPFFRNVKKAKADPYSYGGPCSEFMRDTDTWFESGCHKRKKR